MKVVILCGGQGTRIRGINDDLPKPLIPIGGYPILWHIMRRYADAGFKEFILCLGHKGSAIKDFFINYHLRASDVTIDFGGSGVVSVEVPRLAIDWRVTLAETGDDAMTGSRVKRIERYIGAEPEFMLTYGDGVGDVDLQSLAAFHRERQPIVTVTGVRPPGRFGELGCDATGRVTEFNEKPQAREGRISGGYFVCNRRLFDFLDPQRQDEMLEAEVFQRLACTGQMLMYPHDGFWQCMDTYRDYRLLNDIYDRGNAPWLI